MPEMSFTVKSNASQIKEGLENAIEKTMTQWGQLAQGYATQYCPVDTSNLKNSITYKANPQDREMQVGTNVEYAPYVEFGTGVFATEGSKAKKIPWSYMDDEGKWHTTSGQKAQPYLRPSLENHLDEYEQILRDNLKE